MIYFCQLIKFISLKGNNLINFLLFQHMNHFFIYNSEYFTRIDGVAMRTPLGLTLATVYFCHFERKWLSECPEESLTNVYKRYVDYIFVTSDLYTQVHKFVDHMITNIITSNLLLKLKKTHFRRKNL